MKVLICAVFVALVAVVYGDTAHSGGSYGGSYVPGFRAVGNGYAAPYRNDLRQVGVNKKAEYVGSGTGTARYYGVPGTGNYFPYRGYGGYGGYNDGGYGHGGYGDGGYGGYGYGGHRDGGYGGYRDGGYGGYNGGRYH